MPRSEAFNLDCMAGMADKPDKYWDLAIVDPPYGIEYRYRAYRRPNGKSTKGFKGKSAIDDDPKQWDNHRPSDTYFAELFRVSANQIIWGGNYFALPISRGWIFWDKKVSNPNERNHSDGELAWSSFDHVLRRFTFDWIGFGWVNSEGKDRSHIHPTQKPVALYKWLLTNYAKPGQTILDTHLGSGSSRIAAYDLGFDFTGYELDADYFAAQEERFARHIAQPKLFAPEAAAVEQVDLFG